MLKNLFRISNALSEEYVASFRKLIDEINKELQSQHMEFMLDTIVFSENDNEILKTDANNFISSKSKEKRNDKLLSNINSVIYVPDVCINIERNYLWWSSGAPDAHVMIMSSYLYEHLIKDHLDFGAYCILLYCQYLARFSVNLDHSHNTSRNCLNDFCANQSEILNVFNNDDVFCDTCRANVRPRGFYDALRTMVSHLREKHLKDWTECSTISPKEKASKLPVMKPNNKYSYEIEVFMAKKCINLSELYKKIYELLKNPDSTIDGYSLYEVDGGWRGKIQLSNEDFNDWNRLKELQNRHGNGVFKDLIKPLIETDNENMKYAIFDERSVVLKIIISLDEILSNENIVGPQTHPAFKEIAEIFEKIIENEQSVFYTIKQVYNSGVIELD